MPACINCLSERREGAGGLEKEWSSDPVCKNIFQDGTEVISRERLTQRWIAFINEAEQNLGDFDEKVQETHYQ